MSNLCIICDGYTKVNTITVDSTDKVMELITPLLHNDYKVIIVPKWPVFEITYYRKGVDIES